MEPGSDTDDVLAVRWAADLIGLSVIWFVVGPAIAGTIGLGWGSLGLGVVAVRLSVAAGFAFLAGSGLLLARAAGPSRGRPWVVAAVAVAAVGAAAALVTPFVTLVVFAAPPLTVLLLATGLSTLPVDVGGARPRTWWRVALVAEVAAAAGSALLVGVGPSHLGLRRATYLRSGFSIRLGGQLWASDSARGGLVATLMVTVDLAALLLLLTAVTLTRRWAQDRLDAARPVEPGAPGARRASGAPPLPLPPVTVSVGIEDPPWDPNETAGAWATVDPRDDDDLLRP